MSLNNQEEEEEYEEQEEQEEQEDLSKYESINNYSDIFLNYIVNPPNLKDALNQMLISTGLSLDKVNIISEDIIFKSKMIIEKNLEKIKEKYKNITKEEAIIISSYTCEAKDKNYSPYRLLNKSLVSKNRKYGIDNVSKYIYILLTSLRKLEKYYPDPKNNFLYRCIRSKTIISNDPKKKNYIPYAIGNIKTFWGFTSTSPKIKTSYHFLGDDKKVKIKSGTVFILTGDIWGYDISLFNYYMENEILLEPERKIYIEHVQPEINNIINITCKVVDNPLILNGVNDPNKIAISYKIKEGNEKIKIFDKQFVKNNKYNSVNNLLVPSNWKLKIECDGNEYPINDYFELKNYTKSKSVLEIYLKNINCITNMSHMFEDCSSLLLVPDIYKINTSKITHMENMFYECSSLISLPDISKWNTSKVKQMELMFSNCTTLISLPDISKWNTSKVKDFSGMFSNLKSLKNIPDISKWNTSNAKNMKYMFNGCSSLISLPDISGWDISKVENLAGIFNKCSSLFSLPDISKWDISNVTDIQGMFCNCASLLSIPDISKWNTANIKYAKSLFEGCISLKEWPDISNWNIPNVEF